MIVLCFGISRMGAKLSRKKSEGGTGADEVIQTPDNEVQEEAPTAQPDSSSSFLDTVTQAVEETVNTVTEQISAPVEDVVNKGIKAVESALASVSLNAKEPEQEPEGMQESAAPLVDLSASGSAPILSESTLLDDLLKSQPVSESLIPERETITSQMEEDISNESKDLLECLDKVVTPSADLLDCELTHETTIPNSDLSVALGDVRQEACEAIDPVDLI